MAKRTTEPLREEEKRKLNLTNIKNILGIFRFALPYKWPFIGGIIALLLSSATVLSFPHFAGLLLDIASGQPVKYFTTINQVALTLMGVLVIQSIFSFIRVYAFAVTSERTLADLRQALYKKMIWSPLSFFDSTRVGELMSRITSDVALLQDTFTTMLAELFRQISILIIGTIIILVLAPELTLFMLLTFPVLVILALIFGKYIRNCLEKHRTNSQRLMLL